MIGIEVDFYTGLPRQKNGTWEEVSGTISASASNVVIDSLNISEFDSIQYIMSFRGATQDDVRTLNMKVQQTASGIKEQVYGKLGAMKIGLDTGVTGSSFELLATNPEAFDVEFCLTVLTN